MSPKLPPLPILAAEPTPMPDKWIFPSDDGFYFATANFNEAVPVWRRYKRLGWAKRYIDKERPTKRAARGFERIAVNEETDTETLENDEFVIVRRR